MAPIVETFDLTKRYNGITAVDRLNLRIEEGEIFGFLGPNGAGKTTTILMLLGLTEPTSGRARVCGFDPTREPLKVKRVAGYLPENVGFYDELTALENLLYIARLNGLSEREARRKVEEAMARVGLEGVEDKRVGQFSRGMKQRLGIAELLVKDCRVAFLDEPTSGIDPEGVVKVLELIEALCRDRGMSILLSSHLLYQVQRICHRIGIIVKGRLIAQGSLDKLGSAVLRGDLWNLLVQVQGGSDMASRLKMVAGVEEVEETPHGFRVRARRDVRSSVVEAVLSGGGRLLQLRSEDPTLEEIYLRYFREA